jgi:hypothetical protein
MFTPPIFRPISRVSAAPSRQRRSHPSCLLLAFASGLLSLAGCTGTEPTQPVVDCSQVTPLALGAGQYTIIDAAENACARLPAAGPAGAEYLYTALATQGEVSTDGFSINYQLTAAELGVTAVAATNRPLLNSSKQPGRAQAFHQHLRVLERQLSQSQKTSRGNNALASVTHLPPPVLGEQRTFNVLKNTDVSGTSPNDYVPVTGTAKYIGTHVAIFLDDAAPTPGYSQTDIDNTGAMFDDHLYPIDNAAFGSESDINGDGVILVLLSDHVTRLAGCSSESIVIGYFYPVDLIPSATGSNGAEIFYGLAPDAECGVSPADAAELLPRVFIHEFQHMINYNQHVLVRGGTSEDTWLNEGLSTFAEELGGRQIPDALCLNNDCVTQFTFGDIDNAYGYLSNLESNYLIGPDRVPIPLPEYGAAWLFVRWLADHFAQTPTLGTDLTQKLVNTDKLGTENVASATGADFSTAVTEWQMANYLDNLPGFSPGSPRLQYDSWDFRQVYASLHQQNPGEFGLAYPLVPDNTSGGETITGTLRAGSGHHLLVTQPPSGGQVDLELTASGGTTALPASALPRVGITRIR